MLTKRGKRVSKWKEQATVSNSVKRLVLPALIYRFSIISVKTPVSYFVYQCIDPEVYVGRQETRITDIILKKKKKVKRTDTS